MHHGGKNSGSPPASGRREIRSYRGLGASSGIFRLSFPLQFVAGLAPPEGSFGGWRELKERAVNPPERLKYSPYGERKPETGNYPQIL
jgi:hypothetical protein